MSDPPLSDIDFKNKMTLVRTTLKISGRFRENYKYFTEMALLSESSTNHIMSRPIRIGVRNIDSESNLIDNSSGNYSQLR